MVGMSHRLDDRAGLVQRVRVDGGLAELVPDADRPRAWTLLLDGTPQSHVDLDDPRYLEFEYMRRLGHVADLAAPAGVPLRTLHLGAGGMTLARYIAATRPGSAQLVVESDAALVEFVRRELPLDQRARRASTAGSSGGSSPQASTRAAGRVRIRVGDARAVLETVRAGSFDLVVADVFAGAVTAAHLTSVEFGAAAARALAPSGVYAVNIGDGPPLAHARARVASAWCSFAHVCLIADSAVLKGRRFGNLVLAASDRALPLSELGRRAAGDAFPGRLVCGEELDRFAAGAKPITDTLPEPSPEPPHDLFLTSP
jgi:spermidine synthase